MENTNILCPDCFKGKIIAKENKEGNVGHCNKCGTNFLILGKNKIRYI